MFSHMCVHIYIHCHTTPWIKEWIQTVTDGCSLICFLQSCQKTTCLKFNIHKLPIVNTKTPRTTHPHTLTHVGTYTHVHMHAHTHTCTCICTCTHTHRGTHTHMHLHTHTQTHQCAPTWQAHMLTGTHTHNGCKNYYIVLGKNMWICNGWM